MVHKVYLLVENSVENSPIPVENIVEKFFTALLSSRRGGYYPPGSTICPFALVCGVMVTTYRAGG